MKGDNCDVVVEGGEIVTPFGIQKLDIAISSGRIVGLFENGARISAPETIDARGCIILPGAIDSHVHFREPGLTHKEDFSSGTRAAAMGGVTTAMVMPTDLPWTLTVGDLAAKRSMLEGRAYVDLALQAAIAGDLSNLDQVEGLADAGAISFEVFLGDVPSPYAMTNAHLLKSALDRIASIGAIAGITPADDEIITAATDAVLAEGGEDLSAFFKSRPPLSESLATARACIVAGTSGARIHVRQVSTRASIAVIRNMKRDFEGLSCEITPHNLVLAESMVRNLGPFAKIVPPLRQEDDLAAAWPALLDGTIDIVATDHAPHTLEEKRAGMNNIWKAPGGFPGVQTMVPLLLDAASSGRISYPEIARVVAQRPAEIFGISERKGSISIGKDADLIFVDPQITWTVSNDQQLSKAGFTPFAGRTIKGAVKKTMLRGRVIMSDNRLIGEPSGRFLAP